MPTIDELRGTPEGSTARSNHSKLKTLALAAATAVSSIVPQQAKAQEQTKDSEPTQPKTEQIVQDAPKQELPPRTIDFNDIKNAVEDFVKNTTYYSDEGGYYDLPSANGQDNLQQAKNFNAQASLKEYNKEQKQAFENAASDTIVQQDFTGTPFTELGNYDPDIKNIVMNEYAVKNVDGSYQKIISPEKNPELYESTYLHEEKHRLNDKENIYAPGLSGEQYALLNAYDEISANIVQVHHAAQAYTRDFDFKHFQRAGQTEEDINPLMQALQKGIKTDSPEYKQILSQTVTNAWVKNFLSDENSPYRDQIATKAFNCMQGQDIVSNLRNGNEKEFQKRVENIFHIDGLGKLPVQEIKLPDAVKEKIQTERNNQLNLKPEHQSFLSTLAQGKDKVMKKVLKLFRKADKDGKRTDKEKQKMTNKIITALKKSGRIEEPQKTSVRTSNTPVNTQVLSKMSENSR